MISASRSGRRRASSSAAIAAIASSARRSRSGEKSATSRLRDATLSKAGDHLEPHEPPESFDLESRPLRERVGLGDLAGVGVTDGGRQGNRKREPCAVDALVDAIVLREERNRDVRDPASTEELRASFVLPSFGLRDGDVGPLCDRAPDERADIGVDARERSELALRDDAIVGRVEAHEGRQKGARRADPAFRREARLRQTRRRGRRDLRLDLRGQPRLQPGAREAVQRVAQRAEALRDALLFERRERVEVRGQRRRRDLAARGEEPATLRVRFGADHVEACAPLAGDLHFLRQGGDPVDAVAVLREAPPRAHRQARIRRKNQRRRGTPPLDCIDSAVLRVDRRARPQRARDDARARRGPGARLRLRARRRSGRRKKDERERSNGCSSNHDVST